MGRRLAKLAIAMLASAALVGLWGCATSPPRATQVVAMNAPESLAYGLDTYVLLPRDLATEASPAEAVARNYRALLDSMIPSGARPPGLAPREIHRLHIPVRGFEPDQPIDLQRVDHLSSRIYLDAIACLLPLYPTLRERVLSGPGPFLVTSSPGLNTHAARNRILIGSDSVERLRQREMRFGLEWLLIVDLSQADPANVHALVQAYRQRLDPRDSPDRRLSTLVSETMRQVSALEDRTYLIPVQLAFLPGMAPGQGCSPYTDVLVDSGAVGYFRRAEFLARNGYPEQAVWDLDRTLALEPGFAGAYHSRGLRQLDLGHPDEALSDFNRALQLDPSNPALFHARATAHYKKGHYREAVADIGVYIASHPEEAEPYCNRALAQAHLGAFEPSQQDLAQCRRLAGTVDERYVEAIRRLRQAAGQP